MTLMSAAALASLLSFVVFALFAVWYIAPWLAVRQRAEALIPLLWIHAFRHIALQIFAAQKFGFAVSDAARDQITFRRGARIIPAETGGTSWGSAECRPRSFEEEITT